MATRVLQKNNAPVGHRTGDIGASLENRNIRRENPRRAEPPSTAARRLPWAGSDVLFLHRRSGMHASELVELGALAAAHGPTIIALSPEWTTHALDRYWSAGKVRIDAWGREIRNYTRQMQSAPPNRRSQLWQQVRPILEEILTAEVLSRVWTAVMCLSDRQRGAGDAEAVARSVYMGQMEARNRALNLMVYGQGFDIQEAIALNQLRRRSERWTDLLLGHLFLHHEAAEFAFDAARARDFAEDLRDQGGLCGVAWRLTVASLRAAFSQGLSPRPAHAELNFRFGSAIVELLPAELFDSVGMPQSFWMMRLTNLADGAQELLDELLRAEARPWSKRMGR
jgi:hypothetical protein